MSRKWDPDVDRARDAIFDELLPSGLGAAERWRLINNLAHELAGQIREHCPYAPEAANCIDPEV